MSIKFIPLKRRVGTEKKRFLQELANRHPACQGPGAVDELKLFRRSIRLLPALARRGAAPIDALAIAYNATFLYYHMRKHVFLISPKQILRRYPLSEIARLCEAVLDGAECGFNENWRDDPS